MKPSIFPNLWPILWCADETRKSMFLFSMKFKPILRLTFPLRNAFSLLEKTIDGDQKQHYNLNQICLGFTNFICYVLCRPGLCINKVNLGFQYIVNYECFSPYLFSSFVTLYTRCRELFLWFSLFYGSILGNSYSWNV